jgi:hypothetical protein
VDRRRFASTQSIVATVAALSLGSLLVEHHLSHADYDIAVNAHQKQLPVTLIGDLEAEGRRWRLTEPREISIIEDGSD